MTILDLDDYILPDECYLQHHSEHDIYTNFGPRTTKDEYIADNGKNPRILPNMLT